MADIGKKGEHILPFLSKGVAKIALVVEDVEEAVKQYYNLFGIGPWHFYTFGVPILRKMTRFGKPSEFRIRAALSNMGETRIELIQQLEGDTVYADFLKEHGFGVQHIGVIVDDMKEAIALAELRGISVVMEGIGYGLDGDGHFAYLDTDKLIGVMVELIERPKRKHPPEKIYP